MQKYTTILELSMKSEVKESQNKLSKEKRTFYHLALHMRLKRIRKTG
jgi:hypothetical protein